MAEGAGPGLNTGNHWLLPLLKDWSGILRAGEAKRWELSGLGGSLLSPAGPGLECVLPTALPGAGPGALPGAGPGW